MLISPALVRHIRERSGLSVAECARRCGVTPAHLTNVEGGKRGASPEMVARLSEVLNVPLVDLLAPSVTS